MQVVNIALEPGKKLISGSRENVPIGVGDVARDGENAKQQRFRKSTTDSERAIIGLCLLAQLIRPLAHRFTSSNFKTIFLLRRWGMGHAMRGTALCEMKRLAKLRSHSHARHKHQLVRLLDVIFFSHCSHRLFARSCDLSEPSCSS